MSAKTQTIHVSKGLFLLVGKKIHNHLHILLVLQCVCGNVAYLKNGNPGNSVIGKLQLPLLGGAYLTVNPKRYLCLTSDAGQSLYKPVAAAQLDKSRQQRSYMVSKAFRQPVAGHSLSLFQGGGASAGYD